MDITYLGHSSFRLHGKQATVVCDPFDPDMVGINFKKVLSDIVTISHDHKDHSFLDGVEGVKMVVSGPGEYEISGVSIVGIPTFHDNKKGAERGKNTVFVIEIDNLRIAHLGDLGHVLSEKILEEIGAIDILMVPVGGEYTIGPNEAIEIARAIEPSVIIPMHYLSEGMKGEVFGKLSQVDEFLKDIGLTVEREDRLVYRKGDLQGEEKVVVLSRK